MKSSEEYSYARILYRKMLEDESSSLDAMEVHIDKLEKNLRDRIDAVLRQLSILQREEKELQTIIERGA
ncbi:uncharacterized protein NEMAJ01_0501 [Nematocida major]|uniref:uncharacterized protein n=1 Tax=Nematocida major TaxID=1912982 RepID=UPI002007662B|nr:uncharacterized protein NEMAJ01_0501 [Nematocida major]KAH9385605.1 hypothetical protein NEMAJ01_0501 [Nematocida major]